MVRAGDGPAAPGVLAAARPDMVTLAVAVAPLDGLEIFLRLRTASGMPILMLVPGPARPRDQRGRHSRVRAPAPWPQLPD